LSAWFGKQAAPGALDGFVALAMHGHQLFVQYAMHAPSGAVISGHAVAAVRAASQATRLGNELLVETTGPIWVSLGQMTPQAPRVTNTAS